MCDFLDRPCDGRVFIQQVSAAHLLVAIDAALLSDEYTVLEGLCLNCIVEPGRFGRELRIYVDPSLRKKSAKMRCGGTSRLAPMSITLVLIQEQTPTSW